jgi:hypothetical protein
MERESWARGKTTVKPSKTAPTPNTSIPVTTPFSIDPEMFPTIPNFEPNLMKGFLVLLLAVAGQSVWPEYHGNEWRSSTRGEGRSEEIEINLEKFEIRLATAGHEEIFKPRMNRVERRKEKKYSGRNFARCLV